MPEDLLSLDQMLSLPTPWAPLYKSPGVNEDEYQVLSLSDALFRLYCQEYGEAVKNHDFVTENELSGNLLELATKVREYVINQLQLHHLNPSLPEKVFPIRRGNLPKLIERIQNINFQNLSAPARGENIQPSEPRMPINASPQNYVEAFNTYPEHCAELRKEALEAMKRYRQAAWEFKNGIKVIPVEEEFVSKREAFYTFYHCDDHEVQEAALSYLGELLENDPMTMKTAKGLIALLKHLMNEAMVKNSEQLNVLLQYRLTKAYALTAECYCLQFFKGNLGTLLAETKADIKQAAEEIESLNKHGHPGIHYWSSYAREAASNIETNEPSAQQWYKAAVLAFSSASMLLPITELAADAALVASGDVMALFSVPGHVSNLVSSAVDTANKWNELFALYNQIKGPQSWFERTLTLRRMSRYALHNPESFKRVAAEFKKLKAKGKVHPEFFFGSVNTLKSNTLNSSVDSIREDNLKMLLQFLRTDDPVIESRAVIALIKIAESENQRLSNTAYIIINLLHASKSLRFPESQDLLDGGPNIVSLHNTKPRNITKENVYLSSLIFFMREIADTDCELDYWRHPIPSLLAILLMTANDEAIIAPILRTIERLFPETHGTDNLGNTPYHLTLRTFGSEREHWRDEPSLIRQVAASGLTVSVNHQNCYGATALHMATKGNCTNSMRFFLRELKANPDLKDDDGNVPLHHCVLMGKKFKHAASLLCKNKASLSPTNNDGYTPLQLAIAKEQLTFIDLFIKHDPGLYNIAFKTAITMGSERTLMHVIRQKEALEPMHANMVLKVLSHDGLELSCSEEFALFHINRCEENSDYKESFARFSWPMPYMDAKNILTLSTSLESPSIGAQKTDTLGDTSLILGVSKKQKTNDLRLLVNATTNIDATNHFAQTALLVAVINRNKGAVKLLREHGANPNICDLEAVTPYHVAAYLHDYDLLEELLQFPDIDLDRQNSHGDTPFLIACGNIPSRSPELHKAPKGKKSFIPFRGHYSDEIIKALLKKGADPYKTDFTGNNALHKALCYNSGSTLEYLATNYPKLFWQENHQGLIPLEAALLHAHPTELRDNGASMVSDNLINTALKVTRTADLKALDQQFRNTRPQLSLGNMLIEMGHEKLFATLSSDVPDTLSYRPKTFFGNTPLHVAAFRNDQRLWVIQAYVDHKKSLNELNNLENTAAHLAAAHGKNEFLAHLLDLGAAVNPVNKEKQTPLHLACSEGNVDAITLLQAHGAELSQKDIDGRTPLHHAVVRNHQKCVSMLLKFKVEPSQVDDYGNTALHLACHYGDIELARTLVEADSECLYILNRDKRLPLHEGCIHGDLTLVKFLLDQYERKPEYYDAEDITGAIPLHLAARQGHGPLVEYLVKKNYGKIWSRDINLSTILHAAANACNKQAVSAILARLDNTIKKPKMSLMNMKNVKNERPLHKVGRKKFGGIQQENILELAVQLLKAGAKLQAKDERGTTFLHLVSRNGFDKVFSGLEWHFRRSGLGLKFALRHGSHLSLAYRLRYSKTDNRKNTLLHLACEGHHIPTIDFLAPKGSLNEKNKEGLTPIMLAVKLGYFNVANRLWKKWGAKLTERDNRHLNIIHLILENKTLDNHAIHFLKSVVKAYPHLIKQEDDCERTTLHIIAEQGHEATVNIILRNLTGRKKANFVWAKDSKGETAHEIANTQLAARIFAFDPKKLGDCAPSKLQEWRNRFFR